MLFDLAERYRSGPPAARCASNPASRTGTTTLQSLQPHLSRAAELDVDDVEGWAQLRTAAGATVADLVAQRRLPPALRVGPGDSAARLSWLLIEAWRHATTPAQLRHHRR